MSSVTLDFKELPINNLTIFYREITPRIKSPTPKVLVILHGWNQNGAQSWQEIMGRIAQQHSFYRIIAPDLPGMGQTQPPRRVWGVQDYVDYIIEFLDALKLSNVVMLGHSFGGGIASVIAAQRPDLCQELVLFAPAIVRPPLSSKQKMIQKLTTFGKQTLEKAKLHQVIARSQTLWYKVLGSTDYLKTQGIMKEILTVIVREDLTHILPNIRCDTIIVWGDKDTYTPIWQLDIIRRNIPQNHIYILEGVNHGIHLYAKKSVYAILKKTL
jgi:pimeloyl-ACP methyl ester carboxylesterase